MEVKEKKHKPMTLYLDPLVWDLLDTYCYFTHRNKTRICNQALEEWLASKLQSVYKEEGIAQ